MNRSAAKLSRRHVPLCLVTHIDDVNSRLRLVESLGTVILSAVTNEAMPIESTSLADVARLIERESRKARTSANVIFDAATKLGNVVRSGNDHAR